MASYRVILKPSVEKDLRSLPRDVVKRVFRRIETLRDDPIPRQSIKLSGVEHLYRVRVGEYRIVFSVDTTYMQIVIQYVRHRRDVYRQM
jgi:mRNA interferase RelE/StbE